jgi:cardiolipin synthase
LEAKAGWDVNRRDRKRLLVDGEVVLMGGINISGVYSGGSARSAIARRLPTARTASRCPGATPTCASRGRWSPEQQIFLDTWGQQKGAAAEITRRGATPPGPAGGARDPELAARRPARSTRR